MTQQRMTPTCPITTWFPLRRTFWTEPPGRPFTPSPQLLVLLLFTAPAPGLVSVAPVLTKHGSATTLHSTACIRGPGVREWIGGVFLGLGSTSSLQQQESGLRSPRSPLLWTGLLSPPLHCTLPACFCLPGTRSPQCFEEPQVPAGCRSARAEYTGSYWVTPLLWLLPGKEPSPRYSGSGPAGPPHSPPSLSLQPHKTTHVRFC